MATDLVAYSIYPDRESFERDVVKTSEAAPDYRP